MLSQEHRNLAETWGLSPLELDDLVAHVMQDIDVVCDAIHALLPASSRDVRCSRHVSLNVGFHEQLILLVSAAWWPTGSGGDDLLEIVYSVEWPREPEAEIIVGGGAEVTDWGFLFPPVEQRVRGASEASRI